MAKTLIEEIWKPVKNYEGIYEISNKFRVRSLDRETISKRDGFPMKFTGKLLKTYYDGSTLFTHVNLSKEGKSESVMVYKLFHKVFNII